MLKKFQATNGSGDVFVNPAHVSTVTGDSMTGGVRISLTTGKDAVVIGDLASVAKELGHA